jgi:UDP:flavonoid glycosyltransferase YjiC (YdhE family)
VTVGPEGEPAALGDVPDNVRVERFVAQSAVLPLVDLIVHHGGTEAVQALLGDSPEREAALRLQDEIAAMPSPTEAVSQLVELSV